jgi:hypothetical protein
MTTSWVVVPCQRTRLHLLYQLLSSLDHPVNRVVVVADDIDTFDVASYGVVARRDARRGVNLAYWWNVGLDYVADHETGSHEVMIVTSDTIGNGSSVALLRAALRDRGLSMVGPNPHGDTAQVWTVDQHRSVTTRVPAECFMLRGELGLRADERMPWWYCDDDLEMQARQHAPVGVIGDTGLRTAEPSTYLTNEQHQQAAESRDLFTTKWNRQPW